MKKIKVCVFGLGYIGLPTSLLLADSGFKVFGVDTNKKIVDLLKEKKAHINEPEVNKLLEKNIDNNQFIPQTNPVAADVFLIAVPTPFLNNKSAQNNNIPEPNIEYVEKAAEMISKVYSPNNLIIIESTSPVGTSEKIFKTIIKKTKIDKKQLKLAYCPERVLPGNILSELIYNNRVIGGINKESSLAAKNFYEVFCKGEIRITNSKTAELVKLTENAYRDINIAFANELSIICDQENINTGDLINLANAHPRVDILKPGCGVGGHCIAVDPYFIAAKFPEITPLIQTARKVNLNKTLWCIEIIKKEYFKLKSYSVEKPVIGILGLTYKPNVGDLRESPALEIFNCLKEEGLNTIACEPYKDQNNDEFIFDLKKVLSDSDLLVRLVAHDIFSSINFKEYNFIDFCY